MDSEFERFRARTAPEIIEIQEFMSEMVSDNPRVMVAQAAQAVALYSRMVSLLSHANSFLDSAKFANLKPKEKGETEMDREVKLDAAVVNERRVRDVIEGMAEALAKRISLSQTIINAATVEARRSSNAT